MRALPPLLLLWVIVLPTIMGTDAACAAGEACPDYHREDKAYAARVKSDLKRYARSQGVPERLLYLYDQLGDCPACLGGDAEHPILPYMYIVYSADAGVRAGGLRNVRHRGTSWSADEEYAARQGMRDGYVKSFYILLETTPCECCTASTDEEFDEWNESEPDWTESPDWDDELKIDTSRSDAHENVDELGPDPDDLTEIDDKDRYPDELPVPALELPAPVRPLTTGCFACQELVIEYNDLAIRINEQNRAVALAEQNLKIAAIAIRFALREVRAHELKAQNETWEAEYDRLWQRYGDLVATSQSDQRALDNARAARSELLIQRAALRRAILDCEERCRLLDDQAAPTTDPGPLTDPAAGDAGPALPPYVRIATGACPACTATEKQRNDIARDMNELVQGMIDAGINSNSIKAWEAMRVTLNAANELLRECTDRCSIPIEETPTLLADSWPEPSICRLCSQFEERLENAKTAMFEIYHESRAIRVQIDDLAGERNTLDENQDAGRLRNIDDELRRLNRRLRQLERRLERAQDRVIEATHQLEYCLATHCAGSADFIPNTNTSLGDNQFDFPAWSYLPANRYFFVTTTCRDCRQRAQEINDWVHVQYEDWITPEFLRSMGSGAQDDSARIASRYRFIEFLADLEAQIAGLRACESQTCPLTHGATGGTAYQQDDIAPGQCLEDPGTRAAAERGDADALPDACGQDTWLHRWLFACEDDSCAGTGDRAVVAGGPSAALCEGNGTPVAASYDDLLAGIPRTPTYHQSGPFTWFAYRGPDCDRIAAAADDVDPGAARYSEDLASGSPDDPFFLSSGNVAGAREDQWGLRLIDAYDGIAADNRYAVTGHSVIVAVVDSGLDIHHPDLRSMIWQNPGELPANGVDDDGNGFIDDVHGWNFVGNDNDVRDHNGHGTLVAGIVAAVPNNGIGIAGVNPWARIMPIKVTNFLGRGNSVDIASAITYAVNEGARVINISLGGTEFSSVEQAAVRYAASRGVLVLVAAGNQGADAAAHWPAGLGNVITVSAMENETQRARYSNWGSPVDVAAPGSNILSLRARNTDLLYFVEDDYPLGRNVVGDDRLLYHATGTSFAAPFVTGVASLVMSLRPEIDAASVRRMILNSATDVEAPGIDPLTGFGRVDARATLSADPAYYIDSAISGVSATRRGNSTIVVVTGTADANQFDSAVLQMGESSNPEEWRDAGTGPGSPARDGIIAEIDASALRGSPTWTLRLVVTHEDGSQREARFELNLQ